MKLQDMTQSDIVSLLNDVVPGIHAHTRIVVLVPSKDAGSLEDTTVLCTITKVGDNCFTGLHKYMQEEEGKYCVSHSWGTGPGSSAAGAQYCKTRKELIQHVQNLRESYTKMWDQEQEVRDLNKILQTASTGLTA